MVESDDRAELISEIQSTKLVRSWNAAQTATVAQMTTDLVVGAAVFTADLVLGEVFDGSNDITSKAWLLDTCDGGKLETQKQATHAMIALINKQIRLQIV